MEYSALIKKMNKKTAQDLQKYSKNIPPSYGETAASMMSSDLSNQYIVELIKEKYESSGILNASTQSISTVPSSMKEVSRLLVSAYLEIINSGRKYKGIYTVWTSMSENHKISHQNWLYYDIASNILLRMEPNGKDNDKNHPTLKMDVFCDSVISELLTKGIKATWRFSIDFGINNFSGCRATSTILATMYLSGLELNSLKNIVSEKTPDTTRALAYILQKEMEKCDIVLSGARTRRARGLKIFSPV